jgi:hypothetical protein
MHREECSGTNLLRRRRLHGVTPVIPHTQRARIDQASQQAQTCRFGKTEQPGRLRKCQRQAGTFLEAPLNSVE